MVLIVALLLTFLLCIVCITDLRRYEISNGLNAMFLLFFLIWLCIAPISIDWLSGLYAFGILFGVGFVMFVARLMGGGDVKLLMVLGLWTGLTQSMLSFLLFMSFAGFILAFILIIARILIAKTWPKERIAQLPELWHKKGPVPYGVAIAAGFLIVMWQGRLATLPL